MIQLEFSGTVEIRTIGAPGAWNASEVRVSLCFSLMQAQRADDGQALGKVQAQLPPLEDVGSGQAQKVACARIIYVQRGTVEIAGSARLGAHFPTFVHER